MISSLCQTGRNLGRRALIKQIALNMLELVGDFCPDNFKINIWLVVFGLDQMVEIYLMAFWVDFCPRIGTDIVVNCENHPSLNSKLMLHAVGRKTVSLMKPAKILIDYARSD